MINYKAIGSRIRVARKNSNMTQESLAELISVTPEHMSRLETGVVNISLEIIDRVSEVLSIELENLLFGTATSSSHYLHKELNECLNKCSPNKIEAIVDMAKIISKL